MKGKERERKHCWMPAEGKIWWRSYTIHSFSAATFRLQNFSTRFPNFTKRLSTCSRVLFCLLVFLLAFYVQFVIIYSVSMLFDALILRSSLLVALYNLSELPLKLLEFLAKRDTVRYIYVYSCFYLHKYPFLIYLTINVLNNKEVTIHSSFTPCSMLNHSLSI